MYKNIGFVWDVDGVIMETPHEEVWRIIANRLYDINMSSDFYLNHVASRPRYKGGDDILKLHGVYEKLNARTKKEKKKILDEFCNEKNELIQKYIKDGNFKIYPDAISFILKAKKCRILQATASASKNANNILRKISKEHIIKDLSKNSDLLENYSSLYEIFDLISNGLDAKNKIEILKTANNRLRKLSNKKIKEIVVFEDAPTGIEAAKSLGCFAVGVLRVGSKETLLKAGADIVVRDLRKLDPDLLIKLINNKKSKTSLKSSALSNQSKVCY